MGICLRVSIIDAYNLSPLEDLSVLIMRPMLYNKQQTTNILMIFRLRLKKNNLKPSARKIRIRSQGKCYVRYHT